MAPETRSKARDAALSLATGGSRIPVGRGRSSSRTEIGGRPQVVQQEEEGVLAQGMDQQQSTSQIEDAPSEHNLEEGNNKERQEELTGKQKLDKIFAEAEKGLMDMRRQREDSSRRSGYYFPELDKKIGRQQEQNIED